MNVTTATLPPPDRCRRQDVQRRLDSLKQLIGATPLVEIECTFRGRRHLICAKLESYSLTGSIKDRMALHIVEQAIRTGQLSPGDEIAEATSGNTGIAFAAIGRALGCSVSIFMPDWMSRERVEMLRSLGARIVPVSRESGGFLGSIALADAYAATRPGVFRPQQFDNPANVAAHAGSTGPELLDQMRSLGHTPTAFVAGVGTGGTVMGVGRYLRAELGTVAVHPLEPTNSPTLTTGHKVGRHRIQGISDEFVPAILRLEEIDAIVQVWDGDAIIMAQRLASELGLAVGISSGANLLGSVLVAHEQGARSAVATVFADCNKKYLSTDLCRDEPVREGYLSPEIRLTGFRTLRSVTRR